MKLFRDLIHRSSFSSRRADENNDTDQLNTERALLQDEVVHFADPLSDRTILARDLRGEYPVLKSGPDRLVSDVTDVVEQFVLSHGEVSYRESLSRLMNKYDIPETPETTASFDYFDQEIDSAAALRVLLELLQLRLKDYGEELNQLEASVWHQETSLDKKAKMLNRLSTVLDERNNGLDEYLCSLLEHKAHLDAIDAIITTRLYGECRKFLESFRKVIIPYQREIDSMREKRRVKPTYVPLRRRVYLMMTRSFLEFDRFRRLKHYIASLYKTEYAAYTAFLYDVDLLYGEISKLPSQRNVPDF